MFKTKSIISDFLGTKSTLFLMVHNFFLSNIFHLINCICATSYGIYTNDHHIWMFCWKWTLFLFNNGEGNTVIYMCTFVRYHVYERGCSSVVERSLRMWEAPSSILGISITFYWILTLVYFPYYIYIIFFLILLNKIFTVYLMCRNCL